MGKKVLISVDWFPPAFKAGGPIRSAFNLAAFLSEHAEVWVITSNRDLDGQALPVEADCWTDVEVGERRIHVRYCSHVDGAVWDQTLNEVQPHALHMNSLFSPNFTQLPLRRLRNYPQIRVVLAPRGMLGASALSIKPLKKRIFLSAARAMGWFDKVRWHASTAQEKQEVRQAFPRAEVCIAQNLPSVIPAANPPRSSEHWRVVVIGRLHRVKNLHFGLKAVLEVEASRPVTVNFIGPVEDAGYKQELEDLAARNTAVNVRFHGGIPPAELGPHFHAAHYLLSSTTQENFGHSIVEAWAHGCPVLISDRTPWRNLEADNVGWDWPLDEAAWKTGLNTALALSHEEWEAKSVAARAYFSERVQSPEAERANLALFDL